MQTTTFDEAQSSRLSSGDLVDPMEGNGAWPLGVVWRRAERSMCWLKGGPNSAQGAGRFPSAADTGASVL